MNDRRIVFAGAGVVVALIVACLVFFLSKPTSVSPPPWQDPAASSSATQQLELPDAPDEVGDADADAKPTGTGVAPSNITACCNTLANAATQSPPPNNTYFKAAADYCMGASKSPDTKKTLSQIATLLQGASMPAACH